MNKPTNDLIRTEYKPKPLPDHSFDWEAWFEGYEGEFDGLLIGLGTTKEQAIENLNIRLEDFFKICGKCYGTGEHREKGDGIHDYCQECEGQGYIISHNGHD